LRLYTANMTDQDLDRFNTFLGHSNIEYKKHQYDGVVWSLSRERQGYNGDGDSLVKGGFIADEMGLGKTITMIALFYVNFVPKTLIVVPKVLIHQWRDEIFRTTGHKALIYHGSNMSFASINMDTLMSAPFVITTYHMCSMKRSLNNVETELRILHKIRWDRVVFDEAHHLRNKNNLYYGASKLKANIRWMVSGTPIQNKLKDFHNLCDILGVPSSLYKCDSLDELFEQFVLKRTKKDVGLSLPPLVVSTYDVEWTSVKERDLSQKIHKELPYADKNTRLQLYLYAKQCCILPALLKGKGKSSVLVDERYHDAMDVSSKLDKVISVILSRSGNGRGKLIFCHFREEIDFVIERLKSGGMKRVGAFDGRASVSSRNQMLSGDFEAIVLQIQTGCEGLNLQKGFSEVFFVSPHWNPAVEDQAVARCHRFGQVNEVHVFRFCMTSIEVEEEPCVALCNAAIVDNVDNNIPVAVAIAYPVPSLEKEKEVVMTLDKYIQVVQERKRENHL